MAAASSRIEAVRLSSSNSDASLEFSDVEGDYFVVSLRSRDHSAIRRVCAYTDALGVPRLFSEAARDWKGWVGGKVWQSIEDDLRLELSMDRLGHVELRVRIQSEQGGPDPWRHDATLGLEAGQLDAIARRCERMWQSAG